MLWIADSKIRNPCCNRFMPPTRDSLPEDVATLKAMVIAAQAARLEAEAKARNMEAEVRARDNSGCGVPQPRLVASESVMFRQCPQNPAVVLVVSARFITGCPIQHPFLRIKIARQSHCSLVLQPRFKALRSLLVIASTVQVDHHHARLVPVRPIVERTDASKTPVAPRFILRIDQQMARNGAP